MGETLVLPKEMLREETMYVPGTDGHKMSKSRGNTLNIFASEKELKKVINKQIVTDATPLEEPKDPDSSAVYQIYKLVATEEQVEEMANKLQAGGYGWGHAKKDLLGAIVDNFSEERESFNEYMAHPEEIDLHLQHGAQKARESARKVLDRVRVKVGYLEGGFGN